MLKRLVATTFFFALTAMVVGPGAFFPVSVLAESVEVDIVGSFDRKAIQLKPGKRADLAVYLKSDGDMLGDLEVRLLERVTEQSLASGISDMHGVVRFTALPPGKYLVMLVLPKKVRRHNTAAIGDIFLTPSKE